MGLGPENPVFLDRRSTQEIVEAIIDFVFRGNYMKEFPKRQALHVVVLVPHRLSNGQVVSSVLYEHSYLKSSWEWEYDDIARSKAEQLWEGRNDGGTNIQPHLLMSGDAPYWGGVKREGIVVACSGIQPWLDRMISGMIADTLIGLAYEWWERSEDKKEEVSFVR